MQRQDKAALRRCCRTRRDAIKDADARRWSAQACEHVVALLARLPVDGAVGGYWPIGSELDCRPALAALAAQGRTLALPAVAAPQRPLVFRRWRAGDRLVPGAHGTLEPAPQQTVCVPAVLMVPLLAFDRAGHRLGYGGGYYDRTIAALRARGTLVAVGLGYGMQALDTTIPEDHDARLDHIVTEHGAL